MRVVRVALRVAVMWAWGEWHCMLSSEKDVKKKIFMMMVFWNPDKFTPSSAEMRYREENNHEASHSLFHITLIKIIHLTHCQVHQKKHKQHHMVASSR
jgi:hypothetical protein